MSQNPLQPFLGGQGYLVLDGGLATALEARGHDLDSSLWSARLLLDAPEEVRAVHAEYLEAGADCISTVSYQASFEGFRSLGVGDAEAERLLELSVRLAIEARDDFCARRPEGASELRPLVAASVGPYGAYLADGSEYDGRYGIGAVELDDFHRRRFEVFAASGADIIACETIPSAAEAEVLLGILDDTPDVWAWLSFSCRDGRHISDGTPFVEVAGACGAHERVAAIGVNCTAPRHVAELLVAARAVTDAPLLAYPNSGEAYDADSMRWSGPKNDDAWLDNVDTWVEAGVGGVGGCCRIGSETIRALRTRVARRHGRTQHSG